jgi:hypothetical protein
VGPGALACSERGQDAAPLLKVLAIGVLVILQPLSIYSQTCHGFVRG